MRVEYIKAVIEAELAMERLTQTEQINFIVHLIKDLNNQYPEYNLQLIRTQWSDNALDW